MGIPGLINAIGSGERISLSKLAVSHLERTARPIRVAVDISIWLFQVQAGRGGTNPELRTLFYRLLKFLALPVHPLFVYDGREKPPFKRGKAVSGRSYGNAPIIRLSQTLIDLFKFPRHEAPGEAEAECARLQNAGVVDAVMSNDVDALMFGSSLAVMNFSKESGSGTSAATHVTRYQMQDQTGPATVGLDRAGMILFAMLSGGDYLPSGVPKCGSKLAAEIAKAGFGQDLLEVLESDGAELGMKLSEWRDRLQYELEENESGYFQTKHKAVRIPDTFPDPTILSYYAKPIVSSPSDIESLRNRLAGAWDKEIDALDIRQFAAQTFDWNYRSGVRKVIRLLAEPLVSYRLRLGRQPSAFPLGTSLTSNSDVSMLQKIYKSRASFSTDGLSELQLDMVPIDVVGLDLMAEDPPPPPPSTPLASQEPVEGEEDDDELPAEPVSQSPTKKRATKRYDPYATEKMWIFETIAEIGIPDVLRRWKKEMTDKASAVKKTSNRKAGPKKKGPIDPKMKHGSLLKYGTLTKERSEISQPTQKPLFDAPMSTPPQSSPSMFHSFQESPGSMNSQQRMPVVQRQAPIFDELDDLFSSFSSVSPNRNVKRRPIARGRVGAAVAMSSGDASVESLEASIGDLSLDQALPRPARSIKMSYSNASYDDVDYESDTKDITIASPAKERRRVPKEASDDFKDPPEVQELEESMKSLSLMYPDVFGDPEACASVSPTTPIAKKPTTKATEPKFQLRTPRSLGTNSSGYHEGISLPAAQPSPTNRAEEVTTPRAPKQSEDNSSTAKAEETSAVKQEPRRNTEHLELTSPRNSLCIETDAGPDISPSPLDPSCLSPPSSPQPKGEEEENNATNSTTTKNQSPRKRRTRRVSVVDLT